MKKALITGITGQDGSYLAEILLLKFHLSTSPTEVDILVGNPAKAEKFMGWKAKIMFEELVKIMVKYDFQSVMKKGY